MIDNSAKVPGEREGMVQKNRKRGGFTLVELLIAMVIGIIVIGGLVMTYQKFVASVTAQNVSADLQLSGRAAIEFMTREIRMAGFTQSTGDKYKFGVEEAQATKLRFTWDQMNASTGPGDLEDDQEEIITYYFDVTDGGIKRQLNEGTPNMSRQPLIGGPDGQIRVSAFNFTYRDENDAVITSPDDNRAAIRTIVVTLTAEAPAGRAGMIERTFVNRIRCRNLGI